jgi:hypothetical protein
MNSRRFSANVIPLLTKEGWTRHQANLAKPPLMERPGWSLTKHVAELHSETRLVSDHPVCADLVASRHFLNGAAIPPSQGGEYAQTTLAARLYGH